MSFTIEEIEQIIEAAQSDKERVELMNDFAYNYKSVYPEYFAELSERAFVLSEKLGCQCEVALSMGNRALIYSEQSRAEESFAILQQAEQIMRSLRPEEQRGLNRILNSMGCCCQQMADYSRAAGYFREALNLSEASKDSLLTAKVYTNLTYIYEVLEQYELSLHYGLKAIDLLERGKNSFNQIIALNNVGETCAKMGRYDEALDYLKKAYYLVKRHDVMPLHGPVVHSLGELYLTLENFAEAEKYLVRALEVKSGVKRPSYRIQALMGMGKLFYYKGEPGRAQEFLLEALSISNESSIIIVRVELYKLLYHNYKKMGDFEQALNYFELYSQEKERGYSTEMESSIRNVEAESLKRANERIAIISAIGREITSNLHMERLLDTIYEKVNSLMEAIIFGIATYNRESGSVEFVRFIERGEPVPIYNFTLDDRRSLAAYSIRECRDVFINDLALDSARYLKDEDPDYFGERSDDDHTAKAALFTPLIVGEEVIGVLTVQSYRKGAYSHIDLDSLKVLASYIAIALRNACQAEQIKRKNGELKRLAVTDYLTGIYNRREFEKHLAALWSRDSGKKRYFSILILDADNFKKINDTYGHPAGDDCLRQLSTLLKEFVKAPSSCLARYGGEEFIIFLNSEAQEAVELAERIRGGVEAMQVESGDFTISMTVSIGVSSTVNPASDSSTKGAELLITRADEALYHSKKEGRNRVTFLELTK